MTCILYWLSQEVALLRGIDTLRHFGFFHKKLYLNTIVVPSRDINVFMQNLLTVSKSPKHGVMNSTYILIKMDGEWSLHICNFVIFLTLLSYFLVLYNSEADIVTFEQHTRLWRVFYLHLTLKKLSNQWV